MCRLPLNIRNLFLATVVTFWATIAGFVHAHEHELVTHKFGGGEPESSEGLTINIVDKATGEPIAARFSMMVDGETYTPDFVDENGIRFTSIHESKNQRYTVLYTRGSGPVTVGLPVNASNVVVSAARGFEYQAAKGSVRVRRGETNVSLELNRWVNLEEDGWIAIDEHLHYDRLDPKDDALWLTMLEADGLAAGHFMVLKGGMVPGIWSRQFAFGPDGQASDGSRLMIPGQEYRDSAQGHINLLGIDKIIEPYSTGGTGTPTVNENFPPLHDVLNKARSRNALAGVAHGGTLGRQSTHMADAVLGAVDFWEISNGFIYNTDNWYRLMNCGYFLPMAAGTDLPNWPFRDDWQPFLGSIRMYANTHGKRDFLSFKKAMAEGRTFITGGPLIDVMVNGKGMGETIKLPSEGGTVNVQVALHSPYALKELHIVHDGVEVAADVRKIQDGSINRWSIERTVKVTESGWLAAWGKGIEIYTQNIDAMAHSGVVKVLVGDKPVQSSVDASSFIDNFKQLREYYLNRGVYEKDADRDRVLLLFDRAIDELRNQLKD
ncbi:MAG: CehA/McbA family metallohydrolase [Verrucomicrobia bacterium]|nr:CehA/McbA family metallohydrolase [Verrucomicrobiota bacterium]